MAVVVVKRDSTFSLFLDILRQRTRDVEVKKYCVSILEKLGSFKYTRETLEALDKEARNEVELLGPNPIMYQLLDELLSWRTSTD
jgi:geranylgeranyl diphosphate synthase, type III